MDSNTQQQQQQNAAQETPGTADTHATAPDLTVTKYQQMADDFLKSLAGLSSVIPVAPGAEALVGLRARNTSVSRGFLEAGITAAAEVPELQAITGFDVDAAREALQFIDAWAPVLPSLRAFERRLRFAVAVRKSPLTAKVRAAYAVANGMAKGNPDGAVVLHVRAMKSAAKFGPGRKKKAVANA